MKETEILKNLCYYDDRNPNHNDGDRKKDCYCENCFYGRTQMAEYILKLREVIEKIVSDRDTTFGGIEKGFDLYEFQQLKELIE